MQSKDAEESAIATSPHQTGPHEAVCEEVKPVGDAFKHIQVLFPKWSKEKIRSGVFVGPQVKRLTNSDSFSEKLSAVERRGRKKVLFLWLKVS